MVTATTDPYPARLEIDFPERLSRLSTFFRLILMIPIGIIAGLIGGGSSSDWVDGGDTAYALGVAGGLFFATVLMILFRQRYPRWWFNFARELTAFSLRVGAYLVLLTDRYPATEEEQAVHYELDFPDVEADLNRWLPLVKWILAIPHYVVLLFLFVGAFFVLILSWFAILILGRYPRWMFNYMVGVTRWEIRVQAYMALLTTDRYPPFRWGP